jgi:hypothetical protein
LIALEKFREITSENKYQVGMAVCEEVSAGSERVVVIKLKGFNEKHHTTEKLSSLSSGLRGE